jgi:hypothetical protein
VAVLNACANAGALESVHDKIIESGCEFDVFVGSTLVDIYAKCVKCMQRQKALELF